MNQSIEPNDKDTTIYFSVQDTTGTCYRDVICALQKRGWKQLKRKRMSAIEKKIRLLRGDEIPKFVWTLNEKDIKFDELLPFQHVNHFEGITTLTTKMGLCEILKEMHWIEVDSLDISPRCYNLGDPTHRSDFIDDFRICAAVNLIKFSCLPQCLQEKIPYTISQETKKSALRILSNYLRIKFSGQWWCETDGNIADTTRNKDLGRNISSKLKEDTNGKNASKSIGRRIDANRHGVRGKEGEGVGGNACYSYSDEDETIDKLTSLPSSVWNDILEESYKLSEVFDNKLSNGLSAKLPAAGVVEEVNHFFDHLDMRACTYTGHVSFQNVYALFLLVIFKKNHGQFFINGMRNIWILKAPDACRGLNIRLAYKLSEILNIEKTFGSRTVQKYIERPLLINSKNCYLASFLPSVTSASNGGGMRVKFDLRIWVIVTSVEPPTFYIYDTVYGRCCTTTYSSNVHSLQDVFMHLTNFSIQKKRVVSGDDTSNQFQTQAPSYGLDQAQEKLQMSNNYITKENSLGDETCDGGKVSEDPRDDDDDVMTGEFLNEHPRHDRHESTSVVHELVQSSKINAASHTPNKLRSAVGSSRDASVRTKSATLLNNRSSTREVGQSELLLSHGELMHILSESVNGDGERYWNTRLWPMIKQNIYSVLEASLQELTHRDKSFEFLGFDVMLDEQLNPWILEVNMSPALSHSRSEEQNLLIASMAEQMVDIVLGPNIKELKSVHGNNVSIRADGDKCQAPVTEPRYGYGHWERIENKKCFISSPSLPITSTSTGNILPNTSWSKSLENLWYKESISSSSNSTQRHSSVNSSRPNMTRTSAFFNSLKTAIAISNPTSLAPRVLSNLSVDVNFAAIGTNITPKQIVFADTMCERFDQLRYMQRWFRFYLQRLRYYHYRRHVSVIILQSCVRCYNSRLQLRALLCKRSAIFIQCVFRIFSAKKKRRFRLHTNCATIIQKYIRRKLSIWCVMHMRSNNASTFIQRWWAAVTHKWRVRAMNKIKMMIRKWYCKRHRCAQVVRYYFTKRYKYFVRYAVILSKHMKRFIYKKRFHIKYIKRLLRNLIQEAALYVNQKLKKQLQRESFERESMYTEEKRQKAYEVEYDNYVKQMELEKQEMELKRLERSGVLELKRIRNTWMNILGVNGDDEAKDECDGTHSMAGDSANNMATNIQMNSKSNLKDNGEEFGNSEIVVNNKNMNFFLEEYIVKHVTEDTTKETSKSRRKEATKPVFSVDNKGERISQPSPSPNVSANSSSGVPSQVNSAVINNVSTEKKSDENVDVDNNPKIKTQTNVRKKSKIIYLDEEIIDKPLAKDKPVSSIDAKGANQDASHTHNKGNKTKSSKSSSSKSSAQHPNLQESQKTTQENTSKKTVEIDARDNSNCSKVKGSIKSKSKKTEVLQPSRIALLDEYKPCGCRKNELCLCVVTPSPPLSAREGRSHTRADAREIDHPRKYVQAHMNVTYHHCEYNDVNTKYNAHVGICNEAENEEREEYFTQLNDHLMKTNMNPNQHKIVHANIHYKEKWGHESSNVDTHRSGIGSQRHISMNHDDTENNLIASAVAAAAKASFPQQDGVYFANDEYDEQLRNFILSRRKKSSASEQHSKSTSSSNKTLKTKEFVSNAPPAPAKHLLETKERLRPSVLQKDQDLVDKIYKQQGMHDLDRNITYKPRNRMIVDTNSVAKDFCLPQASCSSNHITANETKAYVANHNNREFLKVNDVYDEKSLTKEHLTSQSRRMQLTTKPLANEWPLLVPYNDLESSTRRHTDDNWERNGIDKRFEAYQSNLNRQYAHFQFEDMDADNGEDVFQRGISYSHTHTNHDVSLNRAAFETIEYNDSSYQKSYNSNMTNSKSNHDDVSSSLHNQNVNDYDFFDEISGFKNTSVGLFVGEKILPPHNKKVKKR